MIYFTIFKAGSQKILVLFCIYWQSYLVFLLIEWKNSARSRRIFAYKVKRKKHLFILLIQLEQCSSRLIKFPKKEKKYIDFFSLPPMKIKLKKNKNMMIASTYVSISEISNIERQRNGLTSNGADVGTLTFEVRSVIFKNAFVVSKMFVLSYGNKN